MVATHVGNGADAMVGMMFFLGAGLFAAMSVAHFTQFKAPLLYIYYDVPSLPYQDAIIAFCLASFAIFSFGAARVREGRSYMLASLYVVIAGLSYVNLLEDLDEVTNNGPKTMYWGQTGLIAGYVALLTFFHLKSTTFINSAPAKVE